MSLFDRQTMKENVADWLNIFMRRFAVGAGYFFGAILPICGVVFIVIHAIRGACS